MADDGAMVVYRGVDNQSEEMIHQGDRRSDKSVTVAQRSPEQRILSRRRGRDDKTITHLITDTSPHHSAPVSPPAAQI